MPHNSYSVSFASTKPWNAPFFLLIVLLFPGGLFSLDLNEEAWSTPPDSLHLSLQQAEALFLEQNLLLMAERVQIDVRDAEIRQARLWENPEFEVEHQIVNRDGSGPLGFGETDNTVFEIEQLITTAGKRGRMVQLRELEKMQAEHQFDLLLRDFKRSLREEFFRLAFMNRIKDLYQEQIDALDRILDSFQQQHDRDDISRLEIIRIRNLLLELEQEYTSALSEQLEAKNALKVLLQLQEEVPIPVMPKDLEAAAVQQTDLDVNLLIEIARDSRSDLLAMQTATDAAQQLLRVERANAYPDVGIGLVYDRLDGPVDNYFGLTLNVQIPLWNRNQGNIRAARHQIRQSELIETHKMDRVRLEVEQSVSRYERAVQLFNRLDESYENDFSKIIQALLIEYQAGEIRLIEFIDHYESFRESVIRNLDIREEFLKAAEELNFTVGVDIFEFNF